MRRCYLRIRFSEGILGGHQKSSRATLENGLLLAQSIDEDKTDIIRDGLISSGVIAQAAEEWKLVYNAPGNRIHEYLETPVKIESGDNYFDQLSIMIEPVGQAPVMAEEAEDLEYLKRRNVVSVAGGEGGSGDEWGRL